MDASAPRNDPTHTKWQKFRKTSSDPTVAAETQQINAGRCLADIPESRDREVVADHQESRQHIKGEVTQS